jgi:hypothetical protein
MGRATYISFLLVIGITNAPALLFLYLVIT